MIKSLLSCFVILFPIFGFAGNDIQLPPHPRLLVSKGEPETIRARMNSSDYAPIKSAFESQLAYETDGKSGDGAPDEKIRQKIEALALKYLTEPSISEALGRQAIKLSRIYLSSISSVKGYAQNLYCYEAVFAASMVYDWCYNQLTPGDKT